MNEPTTFEQVATLLDAYDLGDAAAVHRKAVAQLVLAIAPTEAVPGVAVDVDLPRLLLWVLDRASRRPMHGQQHARLNGVERILGLTPRNEYAEWDFLFDRTTEAVPA